MADPQTTKKKMIWTRASPKSLKNGKWEYETNHAEVRVMAVVENYAMVRRPNCEPFVCNLKDLSDVRI